MSVATLRSDPRPSKEEAASTLQRGHGVAEIAFVCEGSTTRLKHLFQQTPCRVLFPTPEIGDPKLAVLLTTSGGLTGGDDMRLAAQLEPKAQATLTTQAAEKLYRSLGPDVRMDNRFTIAEGAYLEYLPQESIFFDGARLQRQNHVAVAPGGSFLACEMMVFGRAARHERLQSGRIHDSWRVRSGGKLVWADTMVLEDDIAAQLRAPLAFADSTAIATALYVSPDAERFLPLVRKLIDGGACRVGVSMVNGLLLCRLFGASAAAVRAELVRYLRGLRAAAGWPARLPRVWSS
jgi:urease accessory protein